MPSTCPAATPGSAARRSFPQGSLLYGRAQCSREIDEALEIMHRQEKIYVRQHGAHAGRPGLELLVAQERVQPHELPAGLGEALHLLREALARLAVQAVGDEQHAGVLREHPSAPLEVELAQAR